ncbi:MAG: efflux RND transporter periplasmic adaptor subunit [Burkholderiales bacterium]
MKAHLTLLAFAALAAAAFATYRVFLYATPLETAIATESVVPARITGPGTVQGRNPVTLSARVTAGVAKLYADQGDVVKRGQVLAQLDDRDLVAKRGSVAGQRETQLRNVTAAQANLAKAQAELELARSKYRRDADLFAKGYVSQLSFDASIAALRSAESVLNSVRATLAAREAEGGTLVQEARYADTLISFARILAPMDGVIVQRLSETGNTVVPGSPIFRMVDPAAIWVATRVDESVVTRVRVGMPASIRLRTGETLPGKVARIAWQSDAATRELEVDVAFDAPPERFAIDQEAEVAISTGDEKGVVVPVAALLQYQGKQGVLVVRDGHARFQGVQTGAADAANIVIRKGLAAGDVVVAAPQGVKPGTRVRSLGAPG